MFLESILTIKNLIDIFLVAYLLYKSYKIMKDSGSINVFLGILIFLVTWILVSQIFKMHLLGAIFDKMLSVGTIGLIVLFQEDIRRFFLNIGSKESKINLFRLFRGGNKKIFAHEEMLPVVMACANMSKEKIGALIVIEHSLPLEDIVKTGDYINANITQRLIENIFFKNSPLHDGAMVISKGRITAAGCILPVSHDLTIPKHLGLRHRAAMGMSQASDAMVIIVSEETGKISIAHKGKFHLRISPEKLESMLTESVEN